jgi:hypothetical protein
MCRTLKISSSQEKQHIRRTDALSSAYPTVAGASSIGWIGSRASLERRDCSFRAVGSELTCHPQIAQRVLRAGRPLRTGLRAGGAQLLCGAGWASGAQALARRTEPLSFPSVLHGQRVGRLLSTSDGPRAPTYRTELLPLPPPFPQPGEFGRPVTNPTGRNPSETSSV